MKFVNTLRDIFPADGFSNGPSIEVNSSGVRASYALALPTVGVGIFSIQNVSLSASLSLPFVDKPASVRFAVSERHKPFLVTVATFGGGGFFALALNAKGIEQIEASIEFGGSLCLNLGLASGGVTIMAGIYFGMTADDLKLTATMRPSGGPTLHLGSTSSLENPTPMVSSRGSDCSPCRRLIRASGSAWWSRSSRHWTWLCQPERHRPSAASGSLWTPSNSDHVPRSPDRRCGRLPRAGCPGTAPPTGGSGRRRGGRWSPAPCPPGGA